jgi:RND family efflux transporter MFP subunit
MPYPEPSQSQDFATEVPAKADDSSLAHQEPSRPPRQLPSFPKLRWLSLLGAILLSGAAGWAGNWWLTSRASKESLAAGAVSQAKTTAVKLETVEMGIVEQSSQLVGTLEARRAVTLKPEIDGRVSQILVKEGDRVRQGQGIINLDSEDWQAELLQAQAALANAQARLAELQAGNRPEDIAQARASLTQAKARLSNAQAGARPEEIAQAQAQLNGAQAEAKLAQQRVKRYRELQGQGAISVDQFEQYLKEEQSALAALQAAQRRLSQLRESRRSDMDELGASVNQEQENLKKLKKGPRQEEIAQAQAQVAEAIAKVQIAKLKLQKTKITAPFGGIIGDIPFKIGDYIKEGDKLTTLTENDTLELNLSVPLEKASDLRLGLPVTILDSQGKGIATGKISFISPTVTDNAQLILAKATFKNIEGELLDRQLIQAKVIWSKRPGILVPATAISRLGGETFVFVAESSGNSTEGKPQLIARQKAVKLGNMQGNSSQVLEGLKPGDKIVVAGLLNLTDGAPIVRVKDGGEAR